MGLSPQLAHLFFSAQTVTFSEVPERWSDNKRSLWALEAGNWEKLGRKLSPTLFLTRGFFGPRMHCPKYFQFFIQTLTHPFCRPSSHPKSSPCSWSCMNLLRISRQPSCPAFLPSPRKVARTISKTSTKKSSSKRFWTRQRQHMWASFSNTS